MTDLPKPLLATLGVLSEVRRLPAHAMTMGVTLLNLSYKAREDYAGLVARGERVVAEVLGGGETAQEPAIPPEPPDVVAKESAVVLEAVAHVEDPLDRGRTQPEPVPGYDAMTLGALRGRLRSLTGDDLERILTYERAHRVRGPVLTLVEHRLAKLAAE
ncbi:MAG TPA: hypothetical protein VMZ11_01130 [Mycobacteriales bacterium]|nr:hypothetical protein [Mycobacteriales bacterium]